jgi:hypothetical protein
MPPSFRCHGLINLNSSRAFRNWNEVAFPHDSDIVRMHIFAHPISANLPLLTISKLRNLRQRDQKSKRRGERDAIVVANKPTRVSDGMMLTPSNLF